MLVMRGSYRVRLLTPLPTCAGTRNRERRVRAVARPAGWPHGLRARPALRRLPHPDAAQADQVVTAALEADLLGLDSVSIQDHPYQPAFLDTWTLLTHIAARTERITVFPNVANLPLRPPAVLARAAATLDVLSEGRVELGLGAGAFWDAIEAMGGPRRSPGEAVTALEEAVRVIRALWTPGRTPRIDGRHYRLDGAKPGPFPVHPVGIWLGAYKPRMLELTGRLADGWLPSRGTPPPRSSRG